MHQLRDARGIVGLTLDDELVALRADANIQDGLKVAEVVIIRADEGFERGFRDGNLTKRRGGNSRISFCFSYLPAHILANPVPRVK